MSAVAQLFTPQVRKAVATAQHCLFEEVAPPVMPSVQFLGNKERLLPWLFSFAPTSSLHQPLRFLDGFSGSGSVSFEAKRREFQVTSNDLLQSCWQTTAGLVENGTATLPLSIAKSLFLPTEHADDLMTRLFAGRFFVVEEARQLDHFRANVSTLPLAHRTLAMATMNRALTRKVLMGHFAHCQALTYAADPVRVRRNPSIAKPIQQLFFDLLPDFNHAVFDNGLAHQAHHGDVLELLAKDADFDVAYFDPPYCMSHSDYQSFYHLLETFSRGWTDKQFIGGTNRYSPPLATGFDKKSTAIDAFNTLFTLAAPIPLWLISYNDRSYPDIETFHTLLAETGRTVAVHRHQYQASRGGKGSVKGSHEILFVARDEQF